MRTAFLLRSAWPVDRESNKVVKQSHPADQPKEGAARTSGSRSRTMNAKPAATLLSFSVALASVVE